MKITIISPVYPLRGGIAQSTAILYRKLQQRNHTVNIINFKRQYPKIFFPGKTQLDESGGDLFKVSSEQIIDSIGPLSWFKAFRKIKHETPDLVIIRYWMPFFAPSLGTISLLTKNLTNSKILYICDNVIPHEKRFGDIVLTKYAFRRADYFILLSEFVKNDLLEILPKANCKTIPHPVYESFGNTLDKNVARNKIGLRGERVILFFGYIRAYKGLDILIDSMPDILREMDVQLLIVGEFYEDENDYRTLIKNLGIEKNVHILSEFVANEKVNLYFSAADVVVLPYKSATQSGIVQLAYHFNKPCIVTDVGGLSEVVIDNKTGFVVKPNAAKEVAKAVVQFYSGKKEEEFSQNVADEKKKYSWGNMINAIEEFRSNASN